MGLNISRREALRALAAAGVAGAAGCTGSGDGDEQTTRTATTTSTETTRATTTETTEDETAERVPDPAPSPTAAVERVLNAADANAFQSSFHPLHPFSFEQLPREEALNLYENSTFPENATVERVDREVTADLVASATLPGPDTPRSAIEDALDGEPAVVVEVTTEADRGTDTVQFVAVEYGDDGWLILAQGVTPADQSGAGSLAARVVSDVAFDADAGSATVAFVGSPTADSVTVESVRAGNSTSTSTPGSVTTLSVTADPDGDEVVVSATVDGESRVVHRERVPESDRLVDSIEFIVDPETDDRDAIARVNFNDSDEEGRVRVVSTVQGGEAEAEPVGSLNYLNVGVDPDGDEVVVSYPVGGDTEEIHRERFFP
jgi:hypothetical protein